METLNLLLMLLFKIKSIFRDCLSVRIEYIDYFVWCDMKTQMLG